MWIGVVLPLLITLGPKSKAKAMSFQITLIRAALLMYAIGYSAYFFAESELQFYIIGFVDGFGAVCLPIARGVISHGSKGGQGVLFSTIALIQQFGAIIDPVVYGGVYRASVDFAPGFVFLLAGLFCFMGFLVSLWLDRDALMEDEEESEAVEREALVSDEV
jgi:hypothetical protein